MPANRDRRRLLRAALNGAGACALGSLWPGSATRAQVDAIQATALRGNLLQLGSSTSNAVLLSSPDGGLLVDSGSPQSVAALDALVRENLNSAPVGIVFNTHWHLEHTAGNEAYAAQGAHIYAHQNTRLWMSTEYYVDWLDKTFRPRAAAALPTDTFYSHEPQPLTLDFGGERIEYGHLRAAHTDGDIYVRFRELNVLVAGGAVSAGAYPVLDYATGGWIGGLMDATETLLGLCDADTIVVPAAGPPQKRAHLEAQLDMVATVRGRVENLMRQGRSAAEMLEAGVTDEFDSSWGDNRERFVQNVYNGLWWQGRLNGSL